MRDDEIVEVKINKKEVSFFVWIVPIIALIIGGWMIYRYYARMGPEIVIYFKNSGGLEPKHSFIKFRDVKVGIVERIKILRQKEGVAVYARINKDVEPFLNEHTRFWIVKPEIGIGKIRGLDALVSGSYIQMEAKLGAEAKWEFQGLEEPPLEVGAEGKNFKLVADDSYGLVEGLPVYYKSVKVGSIKRIELAPDGKKVYIYIFIKKPFDHFVNSTTKFWNLKAVDFKIAGEGIKVKMGSVAQLLLGGIGFTTKDLMAKHSKSSFWLFASADEALHKRLGSKEINYKPFIMHFSKGVGYLEVGAPVKLQGFSVGKVVDIRSQLKGKKVEADVVAKIDINALGKLDELVQEGLKAKLSSANILTKTLYVELIFSDKSGTLQKRGAYYVLPTLEYRGNVLYEEILKILQKLQKLPIERSLNAFSHTLEINAQPLRHSLQELTKLSKDIRMLLESNQTKTIPASINNSLIALQKMLESFTTLAKGYAKESVFGHQLSATMHDIDKASKALQKLLLKLEKKPNALIFGE